MDWKVFWHVLGAVFAFVAWVAGATFFAASAVTALGSLWPAFVGVAVGVGVPAAIFTGVVLQEDDL